MLENKFNKLQSLHFKKHSKNHAVNREKNLTDVIIPQDVIDVISLGPNFNQCPEFIKKDTITAIKHFECAFRSNNECNNNSNNTQEHDNSWPDENTVLEMRDTFTKNI